MRRIAACIAAVVVMAAPVGTLAGDTPAPRTQTEGADAPQRAVAPPGACPEQFPAALQTPTPVVWAKQQLAAGHLRPWQRQWCERMAAGKVGQPVRVFQTWYGLWEGYHGDTWHIAANPCHLPKGSVVYIEGLGLRVVTNRGASYNDPVARGQRYPKRLPNGKRHPQAGQRIGCRYWVDQWSATKRGDNRTPRLWVVGRSPWPH